MPWPPPSRPVITVSATHDASVEATAASAAEPPSSRISTPAAVVASCPAATDAFTERFLTPLVSLGCRGERDGAGAARPSARFGEAVRRARRGRRDRLRRVSGGSVRLSRAERRREKLDDADDRLRLAAVGRNDYRARSRSGQGRCADPRAARRRPATGHARLRADRPRERDHLRPLLRTAAPRARRTCRRAARLHAAERPRELAGGAALGRAQAAPDNRALARQRSGG